MLGSARKNRSRSSAELGYALDSAVLHLGTGSGEPITARELCQSAVLLGSSGSGKSSVLSILIVAMLRAGFSLVLTTAKPGDAPRYERLAHYAGCGDRLTTFRIGVDRFNPLLYTQRAYAGDPGLVERLLELVVTPMRRAQGQGGERFWISYATTALRAIVEVAVITGAPLSFDWVLRSLTNLPANPSEAREPASLDRSPALRALRDASAGGMSPRDARTLRDAADTLLHRIPGTPARTRAGIDVTATTGLDGLVHGVIADTIEVTEHTWSPDDCIARPRCVVLDAAPQEYGPAALTLQRLLITMMQQAIYRRDLATASHPIGLVMDEAQLLIDPEVDTDAEFMQTARDRNSFLCLASQGLGNIRHAARDARDPAAAAEIILNLPAIKIFTNTTDEATASWMCKTFAEIVQPRISFGTSDREDPKHGKGHRPGRSMTVAFEHMPDSRCSDVASLKRGGPANDFVVEALVSIAGRRFGPRKRASLKVAFNQMRIP